MASLNFLHQTIERGYAAMRDAGSAWVPDDTVIRAVDDVMAALDEGALRVVRRVADGWQNQDWVRQAILLSFRLRGAALVEGAAGSMAYDKIPLKTAGWTEAEFQAAGFRMVPGAIIRRGAFVGRNCVLMPCFVNIGAHIGEGSMIDTWATIGSCAQIGRHVHVSGGAGIGGVLEPLQGKPVIIGDHAFIGARCEIAEGVNVGEGAVIAMGTFLSASTKIVDRASGQIHIGQVPPYAVVIPGSLPAANGGPALACAVIVKTVDARTREKTGVNDLLRAA